MKRIILITVLTAVLLTMAAALFAGDNPGCTLSPEECLKKLNAKFASVGWLGIEAGKADNDRRTVVRVVSGSPAEAAGFQAGDVLVALNGLDFSEANKPALVKVKKGLGPGSEVTYTVLRQGARKDIRVKLAPIPDDIKTQKINEHMKKEHGIQSPASK
jgi:C-terminal processing protease CtpA/Prc